MAEEKKENLTEQELEKIDGGTHAGDKPLQSVRGTAEAQGLAFGASADLASGLAGAETLAGTGLAADLAGTGLAADLAGGLAADLAGGLAGAKEKI